MENIVTLQFDIQAPLQQSTREFQLVLRNQVTEWLRDTLSARGVEDLHLPYDGSSVAPLPGHQIRTEEQDSATHRLTTVDWEFPEQDNPDRIWRFTAVLACDSRIVQAALLVGVRWRMRVFRPLAANLEPGNPLGAIGKLRNRILEWNCYIDGQVIPKQALLLHQGQVDQFVEKKLLSPTRALPLIVMRADPMDPKAIQSLVHETQNQVAGFAQVAALLDKAAFDHFEFLAGPNLALNRHLSGLYWPALTSRVPPLERLLKLPNGAGQVDPPSFHNYLRMVLGQASGTEYQEGSIIQAARASLVADRVERLRREVDFVALEKDLEQALNEQTRLQRENADAVRQAQTLTVQLAELRQQLAEFRALPPPEPAPSRKKFEALTAELEASKQRVQALLDQLVEARADLEKLRSTPPPTPAISPAEYKELLAHLEQVWDENKHLQAAWDAARKDLSEVEADLYICLENAAASWDRPDPAQPAPLSPASGRQLATVADALQAAAEQFQDVLVVWDDAVKSAEQSAFSNPGKVFQALAAVAEVGRAFFRSRNGGPKMGPIDQMFTSLVSFKYTSFESQTTRNLFGAQRVFHHNGQSLQMQRHLTIGGGATNHCLQIYFELDDATRRVLIGYCGRHLPYGRQRT